VISPVPRCQKSRNAGEQTGSVPACSVASGVVGRLIGFRASIVTYVCLFLDSSQSRRCALLT
jgi:hypothetical protein